MPEDSLVRLFRHALPVQPTGPGNFMDNILNMASPSKPHTFLVIPPELQELILACLDNRSFLHLCCASKYLRSLAERVLLRVVTFTRKDHIAPFVDRLTPGKAAHMRGLKLHSFSRSIDEEPTVSTSEWWATVRLLYLAAPRLTFLVLGDEFLDAVGIFEFLNLSPLLLEGRKDNLAAVPRQPYIAIPNSGSYISDPSALARTYNGQPTSLSPCRTLSVMAVEPALGQGVRYLHLKGFISNMLQCVKPFLLNSPLLEDVTFTGALGEPREEAATLWVYSPYNPPSSYHLPPSQLPDQKKLDRLPSVLRLDLGPPRYMRVPSCCLAMISDGPEAPPAMFCPDHPHAWREVWIGKRSGNPHTMLTALSHLLSLNDKIYISTPL
ncbi:hypothetical protein B0H13DRAFT_1900955 [Mycena leptocephala]|nr:hypothetical protein B0H13DRAFT_1900955 [Mycena leptocephala]